jgi:hypothetical protein
LRKGFLRKGLRSRVACSVIPGHGEPPSSPSATTLDSMILHTSAEDSNNASALPLARCAAQRSRNLRPELHQCLRSCVQKIPPLQEQALHFECRFMSAASGQVSPTTLSTICKATGHSLDQISTGRSATWIGLLLSRTGASQGVPVKAVDRRVLATDLARRSTVRRARPSSMAQGWSLNFLGVDPAKSIFTTEPLDRPETPAASLPPE